MYSDVVGLEFFLVFKTRVVPLEWVLRLASFHPHIQHVGCI
jgi:hypothetical protein